MVNPPTTAPYQGPNNAAEKIVPTVSRNNNGMFNNPITVPNTILIAIANAEKTSLKFELFLFMTLSLFVKFLAYSDYHDS
ncbi:hypothetical protein SDC9_149325 [bioreactor metagenome]|uniref:Uncharacterized protein n=1 Tax=bioreactor metagenome TaxID=1076179 RepID=A0A645ELG0_9ZZZZ